MTGVAIIHYDSRNEYFLATDFKQELINHGLKVIKDELITDVQHEERLFYVVGSIEYKYSRTTGKLTQVPV